jgi:carboxyl-terminal processing protease
MSTQNKGIVPDIELPSTWDITTIGESSYPTALSWDVIKPIRHFKFIIDDEIFDQIAMQFKNRLIDEPNLNYLKKIRNRYDLNKNKKLLSLKIEDRELQKELRKNWLLKIENERRLAIGLDAFISYDELEEFNENENDINTNSINLKTDYQLIESTNIMNDYLNFRKKTILSFIQ